ncbi:hypothetical protein EXIGLDRAFT_642899 [Exidia glandulosa HHB12029]|uniref:DUF1665 domain-containing protein n=1 Tax=Exidia glandulosa HHB12029 TaxID=1314781 RepID=A0A166B045_EXIGL|nr:hypothetical protein EXIGLDRAFT_642899 [Exidia glandulosa HHB12029]
MSTVKHPFFPHPFYASRTEDDGEPPRVIAELMMCALSATLRSKPEWWRKCMDPNIMRRWEKEALDHTLSQKQVDYVLKELKDYASLRDEATGIEVSCFDKIWQSDRLIPDADREILKEAAKEMEEVPDAEKDWHPRSNGLVLDLVHPSLFPLVYGHSIVSWDFPNRGEAAKAVLQRQNSELYEWMSRGVNSRYEIKGPPPDEPSHWTIGNLLVWLTDTEESDVDDATWRTKAEAAVANARPIRMFQEECQAMLATLHPKRGSAVASSPVIGRNAARVTSTKFAWLPTTFRVSASGEVAAISYINNIWPEQTALFSVIERILGRFVPMFERVLTDLLPENAKSLAPRITAHYTRIGGYTLQEPEKEDGEDDYAYYDRLDEWEEARVMHPDPEEYDPARAERKIHYTLRDREIQVIVKLANIHLTPENPSYPGGSWHVEGMRNERIVASGIYYYDEDNITESKLAFRTAVHEPKYTASESVATNKVWGLKSSDSALVQQLGAVETKAGRCIAFPNIYQHCVSPFELIDKMRPGHRKILALFLVDPNFDIISTRDVGPQQPGWYARASARSQEDAPVHKLPPELVLNIEEMANVKTMSREQAMKWREELMDERTAYVEESNGGKGFFATSFNMCEH